MAITKDFDKKIGNIYYEKSDNPDMVYQWKRSEVFLKGKKNSLENQIKRHDDFVKEIKDNPDTPYPTGAVEDSVKKIDEVTLLLTELKK